jgi:hypothetical protein
MNQENSADKPKLTKRNPFAARLSGNIDITQAPPPMPPIPKADRNGNPFALRKRKAQIRDGKLVEGSVRWTIRYQDGTEGSTEIEYSSQTGLTDGTLRTMARSILGDTSDIPVVWCKPCDLPEDECPIFTRGWYLSNLPMPARDEPIKSRDFQATKRIYQRATGKRVKVREKRHYFGGDKYLYTQKW